MGDTTHNSRFTKYDSRFTSRELREGQIGLGVEARVLVLAGEETRVSRGGDHCRVIRRERAAREINFDAAALSFGFECGAQFAIGGHAARDEYSAHRLLRGGSECARN